MIGQSRLSLYFLSLLLVISSCSSPLDDVEVITVDLQALEATSYELILETKDNLRGLYATEKASNLYIHCPLVSEDFSPEGIGQEPYAAHGYCDKALGLSDSLGSEGFLSTFQLSFQDRNGQVISKALQAELLGDRSCLSCKLVISFFPRRIQKNSFSKTFCIETAALK